ncbi:MAG: 50S ribosomal protein L28 [Alphaproteobacteria bacterium]|nr:50S ribosomal protein L28 [Alphaproteobacteria bacterium]
MTRRCMLTGKTVLYGNNVSHANNKTRRRFLPNLQEKSVLSEVLCQSIRLRLTTNAIRSIEFHGGFDNFVMRAKTADLDPKVAKLKKLIAEKKAAQDAAAAH